MCGLGVDYLTQREIIDKATARRLPGQESNEMKAGSSGDL